MGCVKGVCYTACTAGHYVDITRCPRKTTRMWDTYLHEKNDSSQDTLCTVAVGSCSHAGPTFGQDSAKLLIASGKSSPSPSLKIGVGGQYKAYSHRKDLRECSPAIQRSMSRRNREQMLHCASMPCILEPMWLVIVRNVEAIGAFYLTLQNVAPGPTISTTSRKYSSSYTTICFLFRT
ncbi:hypothetical protein BC835DRAFT_68197 [Cytidiella melzeri]|nr:hypothetical protein BC835DRAFT_68197 [Cytidiella melzeri]